MKYCLMSPDEIIASPEYVTTSDKKTRNCGGTKFQRVAILFNMSNAMRDQKKNSVVRLS